MPENKTPTSRNEWIFGKARNIFKDKDSLLHQAIINMLDKSVKMFKYRGLPETITVKDLETYNQVGGFSIWSKVDDKLYCFQGGLGGKPNPYYLPTIAIVANPALSFNRSMEIDKECVVMLNDYYYQGLMPMFNKYANLLIDAETTLRYALINARVPALVQADNDDTAESARAFFEKIERGEGYGIIAGAELIDGIKSEDFYKQSYITEIIESIQYIKGSWYNELGLSASFNMKREALNESEVAVNEDILYPFIDSMLECRKAGLEKINKMFGTDITVELDSVWLQNRKQESLALEEQKANIHNLENSGGENSAETENDNSGNTNDTTEN